MKGVHIKKAEIVHSDQRRSIIEIMNGELSIKNMKILIVKEDSYLGGHWHVYPEVMHILKGKAWNYTMKNIDTGEEETFELNEGDTVFRTGRIIHGGDFKEGSIVLDGASESYISSDFNDIVKELKS